MTRPKRMPALLFSIYDDFHERCGPVIECDSPEELGNKLLGIAERSPASYMIRHASSHRVFCVAAIDDQGILHQHEPHECVGTVFELVTECRNRQETEGLATPPPLELEPEVDGPTAPPE